MSAVNATSRLPVVLWLAACACPAPVVPTAIDAGASAAVERPTPPPRVVEREPTAEKPEVEALPVCENTTDLPLVAASRFLDEGQNEKGLSCAAKACALAPLDPLAHAERANALTALKRYPEAEVAVAHGLAVDPASLDVLLAAAHLYAVALPSSREHDEMGALYAERGLQLLEAEDFDADDHRKPGTSDEEMKVAFARISAMAHNDLGESATALDRAGFVLSRVKNDPEARYERALALFELCQFEQAKQAFTELLGVADQKAHAHQHLALLYEREGKNKVADKHFEWAHQLNAEEFPRPVLLTVPEFKDAVNAALAALPADMKKDLGEIPVATEDVPQTADLTADQPPLSPTILGLFRGPPLDVACDADAGTRPCRSIVLYRKNLGRAVKTKAELLAQIRVTLLHEVGHLRGEDDYELAARGLE